MDTSGADAYVYAKACGMYARSFVGPRARKLFEPRRLPDLWKLLYDEDVPLVPEGMLAQLLERKALVSSVADCIALVRLYDSCDPVSRILLSMYDFNNLKTASYALENKETEKPFMIDISPYGLIKRGAWPNLGAMTSGTVVSWYNRVPAPEERIEWETRLDHQYYRSLWDALQSLGAEDRAAAEPLIRDEIILQNIIWAMRLKVYYNKNEAEIVPLLAGGGQGAEAARILRRPAMDALRRSVDSWNDWVDWKYSWLLNPHEEGAPWSLDPRWAQMAADRYLFRLATRSFHRNPFTVGVLVSFFKIKQLEEQMIRVAAEALRLDATEGQLGEIMGDSLRV